MAAALDPVTGQPLPGTAATGETPLNFVAPSTTGLVNNATNNAIIPNVATDNSFSGVTDTNTGVVNSSTNTVSNPQVTPADTTTSDGSGPPPVAGPPPASPGTIEDAYKDAQGKLVLGKVTDDMTVQGQLGKILKTGNPLLDAAKARAVQGAAARGMQNSTMASQAGEEAMVHQALPIAQQDAQTFYNQSIANQDTQNKLVQMGFEANSQLVTDYAKFMQSNYINDKDNALKAWITNRSISSNEKIASMNNATQLQAAGISAGATVESARIHAASSVDSARIQADTALQQTKMTTDANLEMNKKNNETSIATNKYSNDTSLRSTTINAQVSTNNQYTADVTNILNSDKPPEDKKKDFDTLTALHSGSPYFTLNTSALDLGNPYKPPVTTNPDNVTVTPVDNGGNGGK